MQFIKTGDLHYCAKVLAARIILEINAGNKVLWLICGGSNLPIAGEAMNLVRAEINTEHLHKLKITLTDERYGKVGHKDSNWKQLMDLGFNTHDIEATPILYNDLGKEEVVSLWGKKVQELYAWADVIVGQYGLGADGHITGVLPHSVGVASTEPAVVYQGGQFERVSLSLNMTKVVSVAYAFAFGEAKRNIVQDLENTDKSLDDQPAQVLKLIPEAYLYSDQL